MMLIMTELTAAVLAPVIVLYDLADSTQSSCVQVRLVRVEMMQ